MSSKHDIHLADTRTGLALLEMAEDSIEAVVRHYQDVTVSDKPSKIKLELTILPSRDRNQYSIETAVTTALSPRKTAQSTLYGKINRNDQVEVVEFNPNQSEMDFTGHTPI